MTFLVELGTAAVKTAAKAAAPMVKSTAAAAGPALVNKTVEAGLTAVKLAEPVKAVAKPAFEAAKSVGELGKGIHPAITARVLDTIPAEARLSLLQRGFFSKQVTTGEIGHAPTLTPTEMKALGNVVGITLPDDVLENPAFAQSFSDALQNRLLNADREHFSLESTIMRSLRDMLKSKKDANDVETIKRQAIRDSIRDKMDAYRKSIMEDPRLHKDEREEALNKVNRLEFKLNLAADIRMVFGRNFVTDTIESFLGDPKTA